MYVASSAASQSALCGSGAPATRAESSTASVGEHVRFPWQEKSLQKPAFESVQLLAEHLGMAIAKAGDGA
jgi:hypothetical protein